MLCRIVKRRGKVYVICKSSGKVNDCHLMSLPSSRASCSGAHPTGDTRMVFCCMQHKQRQGFHMQTAAQTEQAMQQQRHAQQQRTGVLSDNMVR